MPKVGKIKLVIEGSSWGNEYPLFYTQKRGFELRDLPEDFINLTGVKTYGYTTESALRDAMYPAAQSYKELSTKRRKVIVYICRASEELTMNKIDKGHYQGTRIGVSKKIARFDFSQFNCLSQFGIDFEIMYEVSRSDGVTYYNIDKNGIQKSHGRALSREFQVIEWTQQREDFFASIVNAMQNLVLQLSTFFDKNAEQAIQFIDTKQKLLGGQ